MHTHFWTLVVVALCASSASAAEYPFFAQPRGFSILEPQSPPPEGGPFSYAYTGDETNWNIATWNIPVEKLPPFQTVREGSHLHTISVAPESSIRIEGDADGYKSYQLVQDGGYLPCEMDGRPRESDFLIGPNSENVKAPATDGYLVPTNQWALTSMTQVVSRATVGVHFRDALRDKGCAVTQGSALISVILNNFINHQTLFYKVSLSSVCGSHVPAERAEWCETVKAHPHISYYSVQNPFGVDDQLPLLGQPWMENGDKRDIEVDLLPRLLQVVEEAPAAMDHDPSHWILSGYYNGQHIWGDLIMESSWKDFSLTIVAPDQTPSQ